MPMTTIRTIFIAFLTLLSLTTSAQTISSTVVDAKTGEPIPFATVETGKNQGVITNEEGVFTVQAMKYKLKHNLKIEKGGYAKLVRHSLGLPVSRKAFYSFTQMYNFNIHNC